MSGHSRSRTLWIYEKNHLKQPFIRLGMESLTAAGHSASMIDTSNKVFVKSLYPHVGLTERLKGSRWESVLLPHLRRGFGAYSTNWVLAAMLFKQTIFKRPATIVTSLPLGLMVGWLASRILKARLVYYPLELYGEQRSPFSPFLKKMERFILKTGVDALITQNGLRAGIYVKERGSRVRPTIVHNYKPHHDVKPTRQLCKSLHLPPKTRVVLYEGLVTPGRWLENLIQSVVYLPDDSRLVLMGYIDNRNNWWQKDIEALLKRPEIGKKVLTAPWVRPDRLLGYVADADVGVIIYDDTSRNSYFCEPGKLSDYVLAGVPVVAPNFPTIGPVVGGYGIGEVFDGSEPRAIAQALNRVLSLGREHYRQPLKRAGQDLVWETQLPGFLKAVTG
jgi:glycosyltransferase involved in cell wall biosynthesis